MINGVLNLLGVRYKLFELSIERQAREVELKMNIPRGISSFIARYK